MSADEPRATRGAVGSADILIIAFRADGGIDFFPRATDPEALAGRFAELIRYLLENPAAIRCAAGDHARCPA